MSVFENYSTYYELLYEDKDYVGEADYVQLLLQRHAPAAKSIMDLGCGTGKHAALLVERGYEVHGVDLSESMLESARRRLAEMPGEKAKILCFAQGDIRNYRTDACFDAVISLFHVMSYQTTNEDLRSVFATASYHLKPGGVFIFDCWYGPAVLTERPEVRVKKLENEKIQIIRIAEPVLHANDNCVDVNYHMLVRDKSTNTLEQVYETHRMRYLFCPEIDSFLESDGLARIAMAEWMTGREPGTGTWGVCFVCRSECK